MAENGRKRRTSEFLFWVGCRGLSMSDTKPLPSGAFVEKYLNKVGSAFAVLVQRSLYQASCQDSAGNESFIPNAGRANIQS